MKLGVKAAHPNTPSRRRKELSKNLVAYSFILPNLLGFAIFTLVPMVFSLGLALMNWDGANQVSWVGLQNFKDLLHDSTFKISLENTLWYVGGTVPLTMICSLGLAVLLNQPIRGRNLFRTIYFFPYVASLVAVAVVWNMLFFPSAGPVNEFLRALGVANPPRWSASVDWAMPTVIMASIWRNMGYYMIIYLAALQGIPPILYEAAAIDGANAWQKFRYVTVPMLTPATFFISIMLTITSFKVFDLILVMTNGGPGRATNVLVMHTYNTAFRQFKFGYSSAIAMVLFALVMIITIVQFYMEKRWVEYSQV
ncbi:carbohydrate ABC transporter permease [Aggregatilinea sp.]|jgi:multiple sugar transport system permease protein|uniref:carbohydrate ABC transporter permease n=1 Tax=Aggregatilinea sp. TaxID=2806333 RepID=UPI0032C21340